jgi:hypothetical protein
MKMLECIMMVSLGSISATHSSSVPASFDPASFDPVPLLTIALNLGRGSRIALAVHWHYRTSTVRHDNPLDVPY